MVVDLRSSPVNEKMIEAHMELMAVTALQKLLRSRTPSRISLSSLQNGCPIWAYYKTSKENVPIEWIISTSTSARPHFVVWCRSVQRPPMVEECEHVRIQKRGEKQRNWQGICSIMKWNRYKYHVTYIKHSE